MENYRWRPLAGETKMDVMTKMEWNARDLRLRRRHVAFRLDRDASDQGEHVHPAGFEGLLDCCKEPPLSLALFVPWLMEGGKQTLFLTHMSSFAQVMLHKSSQSRNNGDRLG